MGFLALFAVGVVADYVMIPLIRKKRVRRIPIHGSGHGRTCPICGAGPGHLCHDSGVTLLWEMHERRDTGPRKTG